LCLFYLCVRCFVSYFITSVLLRPSTVIFSSTYCTPTDFYSLSLHDALPIFTKPRSGFFINGICSKGIQPCQSYSGLEPSLIKRPCSTHFSGYLPATVRAISALSAKTQFWAGLWKLLSACR